MTLGYLALIKAYIEAINSGNMPCIESARDSMVANECSKACDEAIGHYKEVCLMLLTFNFGLIDNRYMLFC